MVSIPLEVAHSKVYDRAKLERTSNGTRLVNLSVLGYYVNRFKYIRLISEYESNSYSE